MTTEFPPKHGTCPWMRPLAWGLAGALTLPAAAWASGREPADAAVDAPASRRPGPASVASTERGAASRPTDPTQPASGASPTLPGMRRVPIPAGSLPTPADGAAQRATPPAQPDFLFGRPRASIGLRGQWHRARAASDFYDFMNDQLFVPRSSEDNPKNPDHGLLNFNAPGIGFDFGFGVTSRLDVRVGLDYAQSLNESELRHFIGRDGLPYLQRTELSQMDLRGELVFALAPRGRSIGQYAWIPNRVVPYVGAGLGFVRYGLEQSGEFVDDIGYFEDVFTSKGWGSGIHLFGGADIQMTRHAFLNAEIRHVEASAGLSGDFAGFDPLDLGGLRVNAGVRFVF